MGEELELARGQIHHRTTDEDLSRVPIDDEVAELETGTRLDAPLTCCGSSNTDGEFTRKEWFDHVVLRAELETPHAVDLFVSRAEHNHRNRMRWIAEQIESRPVRQLDIDDHHVGWIGGDRGPSSMDSTDLIDRQAVPFERATDELRDRRVVLDDEHAQLAKTASRLSFPMSSRRVRVHGWHR